MADPLDTTETRDPGDRRSPGCPRRRFRVSHLALVATAVLGVIFSARSARQVRQLREEREQLAALVGEMEITDPDRVWITAIASDRDSASQRVWKFRVYMPAKYNYSLVYRTGPIAADSPRAFSSSGGSSWSSPRNEPVQSLMNISFVNSGDEWQVHKITPSSRGRFGISHRQLDSAGIDRLVVTRAGEDGAESFAVDEPICLLRVRSPEPSDQQKPNVTLYDGFYFYLVPKAKESQFRAARRGKTP